ncbi:MAG: choice-of-anchor E domain-containing protein [Aquabacterium sp.]|nr:choice-of-anchor E domain-containing protein [Aquabacterium sp.]
MRKIIGLLAAGALSTGAAQATLFSTALPATTAPSSSSSSPTDLPADWTTGQVVLTLPKFDPSLGTLHAVQFQFSGELRSAYSITSAAGSTQTVTITPTFGAMIFLLPGGITETLDLLGDAVSFQLGAGSTFTSAFTEGISQQPRFLASSLGAFIGPGTFDIDVLATAAWDVSSTDDLGDSDIVAFGNASVQVLYDYTANRVPEPSALALFGLALAAAALTRRRA